jgi:outer membrane protein insertion porin family
MLSLLAASLSIASESSEVIRAIQVEGLSRIPAQELTDIIAVKKGAVLDRQALKNGIRRAFAKGIFYDIQAITVPYEDGIMLKYVVNEIPVVRKIIVEGNRNISGRKIRKKVPYEEGDDFREEYLEKTGKDLTDFYRRRGFPDAAVSITSESTKKMSEIDLRIRIDEGNPLVIETIETSDDVRTLLRVSEGSVFDIDVMEREMKRLEDYFKKQGFIHPDVGPYQFSGGRLVIPVSKGQRLEMLFDGNTHVSSKKLRNEAPFFEDGEVTDATIQEAIDRMRNLYISSGYYHVQIAAGIETEGDLIRVTFIFFEGKKVTLKKITFEGISISTGALKNIIPLVENKPYDDTLLEPCKESILRLYNALGYLSADVTATEKEFQKDGSELYLTLKISEGPQTKIRKIGISGNERISASEIRDALQLQEGAPYNVVDIGDARYRILALYGKYGYIDARVEVESAFENEGAFINFKITEGMPSVIGKIIYRGNRKTKNKIIDREFTVKEGDPFNYEELLKTKQRLYKLGIFSEVSIDPLQPEKAGDEKISRDLLVSLREGNAGSVEISLGYGDYEKFRGALDINYRNIGGYNRQVGFRAEASSVEKRYILSFREPRLFNIPDLPFTAQLMQEDTRSVNIDTGDVFYEINRQSLILGIEKELRKRWKAALSYEYSFVDTHDVAPGVVLSKEDSGTLGIGSVSPSIFYDTRDDPFDPTTGSLHGIVLKIASAALLSETEFIKGTFQSSWFFPLPKKIVFAFSLRGGVAYSLDKIKELPLIERFFLGGRTTVRGYNNDTLGPKGVNDTPTGGNIFVLTNGEFRIPLGKGFGLVTFVDAGNVWQLVEDINDDLKYTAGIGLRYKTPVGPIRVDYGHKMNREKGESKGEVHFSFGHAF